MDISVLGYLKEIGSNGKMEDFRSHADPGILPGGVYPNGGQAPPFIGRRSPPRLQDMHTMNTSYPGPQTQPTPYQPPQEQMAPPDYSQPNPGQRQDFGMPAPERPMVQGPNVPQHQVQQQPPPLEPQQDGPPTFGAPQPQNQLPGTQVRGPQEGAPVNPAAHYIQEEVVRLEQSSPEVRQYIGLIQALMALNAR